MKLTQCRQKIAIFVTGTTEFDQGKALRWLQLLPCFQGDGLPERFGLRDHLFWNLCCVEPGGMGRDRERLGGFSGLLPDERLDAIAIRSDFFRVLTGPIHQILPLCLRKSMPMVKFELHTARIKLEAHLHRNAAQIRHKICFKIEKSHQSNRGQLICT